MDSHGAAAALDSQKNKSACRDLREGLCYDGTALRLFRASESEDKGWKKRLPGNNTTGRLPKKSKPLPCSHVI